MWQICWWFWRSFEFQFLRNIPGTTHNGGYIHDTVVYALKGKIEYPISTWQFCIFFLCFGFIEVGYRHIDTARRYGVEKYLGQAIEDSGIERTELFLSTKLWPQDYGKGSSKAAALKSMHRMNTDYLDLYLLHWPICSGKVLDPKQRLADSWRDLELLLDQERIRAIGVSNFLQHDLEDLMESMDISGVVPHVNQCEFHPYQNPYELRRFCNEKGWFHNCWLMWKMFFFWTSAS